MAHRGEFAFDSVCPRARSKGLLLRSARESGQAFWCSRNNRAPQPQPVCTCGMDLTHGGNYVGHDGDHDESDCSSRAWVKTLAHNALVNLLVVYLRSCGMQHVRSEIKYWDPCRVGKGNGTRRVPDILCTSPDGLTDYVIDCRISWQVTSITGNNGFASYTRTGCKAEAGEKEKQDSWNEAIQRRQDIAAAHVSFVPFSIEAGGVWGPAAQAFFEEAAFYNHYNERDIDRYHWNTAKFKTLWRTKFAVLMARERGRIGSDAALGDMPKRLQAHSYDEMNEGPAR